MDLGRNLAVRPKSSPEIRVAAGQMLGVFLERLTGRPRSTQPGFRLGMVAHVTFATFFLEDLLRDVINPLELPYAIRAGPHFQLRQAVGIGQRRLIDVTPLRHEPAPEVLETVIGAAAIDHVCRAPKIPGVCLIEVAAKRHLERYDFLWRELAQRHSPSLHLSVRIMVGPGGALNDLPE